LALAARLEIRQGQGLVITPQLQQAIKLLQLSNLELEAVVEAELERNPLLQRDEPEEAAEAPPEAVAADVAEAADAAADMDVTHDEASPGEHATGDAPEAPGAADAGGSVDWSKAGKGGFDGDLDGLEDSLSREKTLPEHLHDQLAVAGLTPATCASTSPRSPSGSAATWRWSNRCWG
jgi:RNA polymerase sigma-54 factor